MIAIEHFGSQMNELLMLVCCKYFHGNLDSHGNPSCFFARAGGGQFSNFVKSGMNYQQTSFFL